MNDYLAPENDYLALVNGYHVPENVIPLAQKRYFMRTGMLLPLAREG